MADEIFYGGPKKDYTPTPGANRESTINTAVDPVSTTYADMDYLMRLLTMIQSEVRANIYIIEAELNQMVLVVKDGPEDDLLRETLREEWPTSQGTVKNYVPYPYYKALEARDTAAATYIRKRWETAARDIGGPGGFDLIKPLYVIRNEAELVVDFIARYIGSVDDSSEERIVELLQEWAAVALAAVRNIRDLYRTQGETQGFSKSELDSLNAQESAQYQAIFKVKVNEANSALEQSITALNKSYAAHSSLFYNRVLGPALDFRLNASRKIYPGNSTIAKVANKAAESLNMNLSLIITDLMRRNTIFTEKIDAINDSITIRDKYRYFVVQLAVNGKRAVPTALAKADVPLNPDDWFDPIVESATPTTYRPSHSKLADVDWVDAHPQYLDRFGRNLIEGDIEVKPGVKIGGVDLSGVHDGTQGSPMIKGSAIDGMLADNIDRDVYIEPPSGLRLVSIQNGNTGVDAHVVWDADRTHLFDVQITPVEAARIESAYKEVYSGDPVFSGYTLSLQTIDGKSFYKYHINQDGLTVKCVSQGIDPVDLYTATDILNAIGYTGDDPGIVDGISIGIGHDWEMTNQGDVYFAVQFQGNDIEGIDETVPRVLKYDKETNTLAPAIFLPGEFDSNEDYPNKLYSNTTYDPKREKLYLYGANTNSEYSTPELTIETFLEVVNPGATASTRIGAYHANGPVPFIATDHGADGYIYGYGILDLADVATWGLIKINPLTGEPSVLSELPYASISSNPDLGYFGLGLVVTLNEILIVSGLQATAVSLDGLEVQNITNTLPFPFPSGVCKDKYGRVYMSCLPYGQIYRVFGPEGANVFS